MSDNSFVVPIKSESDDREYRIIRLENDLEILLVHDATNEKVCLAFYLFVIHLFIYLFAGLCCFCVCLFVFVCMCVISLAGLFAC